MSRQILFGTVVAAAMAVGVGAQQPQQTTPQTDRQSSMSERQSTRGQSVTLTGCLQRGDQSGATGTTGTTSPASSSGEFVLNSVQTGSSTTTTTANPSTTTTGTTGSSEANAYKDGVKLSASPSEDLSKHINKKVEVRGTIESSASSSPSPSPTTEPSAGTMSAKAKPTLKVSSIRELAESCSGQ